MEWKKGRGKLGIFLPLLGSWQAKAKSQMGPTICQRNIEPTLQKKYIQMCVDWRFADSNYQETALIGIQDKKICIWSFTSDGKQSQGQSADVTDLHPQAIGFESQMPAGLVRQAYWPDAHSGFHWVVESSTKKGWNRFVSHHYKPIQ